MPDDKSNVLDLMKEVYFKALREQDPEAVRKLSAAVDRFHDKREFHRIREAFLSSQIEAFVKERAA